MAKDLNVVCLVGNLVRDCGSNERDFAYLQNGTAVAHVSIANNQPKKKADESWEDVTSYFDVTLFGKTAENLKPYLLKGQKIAVEGSLKQERWQDQQGNNNSRVVVIANNIQLVGAKKADEGFSANKTYSNAKKARQASEQAQSYSGESDFPEDIPF